MGKKNKAVGNTSKLSRLNPEMAYQVGLKKGKAIGVDDGFLASAYLILLGMHNVNSTAHYLSKPKFAKFFAEAEKEVNRIFHEEYQNDAGTLADVRIYYTKQLRQELGIDDLMQQEEENNG